MTDFTQEEVNAWSARDDLSPQQTKALQSILNQNPQFGGGLPEPFVPMRGPTDNPQQVLQDSTPDNLKSRGELISEGIGEIVDDPMGTIVKPVAGFAADVGSGIITAGEGAKQFATEAAMKSAGMSPVATEAVTRAMVTDPELQRQQKFDSARKQVLGSEPGVGEFLGQAAIPIPGPSKVSSFGRAMEAMKLGALSGSLEFAEGGSSERANNILFGIAAGPLAQLGAEVVSKLPKALSTKLKLEAALDSPSLTKPEVKEVLKSAESLGITVTPGEASGDLLLLAQERSLNLSTASRAELRDFLEARHARLVKDIDQLKASAAVNDRGDELTFSEFSDEVNVMREDVYSQTLDTETLNSLLSTTPNLKVQFDAYAKALRKGPNGKLNNTEALAVERFNQLRESLGISDVLPVNNVGFIDQMLGNMDSFVNVTEKGAKKDFAAISKARERISTRLKKEIPGYADYKVKAQRIRGINYMQEALDEIPDLASQPQRITSGFYEAILSKPKTRKELLSLMGSVPGAEKKINDLANVMGTIFQDEPFKAALSSRLPDILAEGGTAGAGMLGAVAIRTKKFFGEEFDRSYMEYISNPNWTQDITQFVDAKDRMKTVSNLAAYFSRVLNVRDDLDRKVANKVDKTLPISGALESVL